MTEPAAVESTTPITRTWADRHACWIVVLLVLVLAGITAQRTFGHALWGDEFRTWRDGIEKPLSLVLTWHHNPDHAPLGHLLARAGASLFGVQHAWALRLGSWLCGLISVPLIFWLGRSLWSSTVGLLMATMFVVDSNIGYQMTQARMYAPLMLATIAATGLAGSLIVRPARPGLRVVLLGLAIGVGVWSHATIFAVVLALLLVGLGSLVVPRWQRVGVLLSIGLVIGLLVGVQGVIKIVGRHDAEAVVAFDVTDSPAGQFKQAITQLAGKSGNAALNLVVSVVGLFVIWKLKPSHRPLAILLGLTIGIAILNLAIAVRYRPIGHARYLTVLQPAVWFAMAVLIVEVWRVPRHGRTLGILGVIVFGFFTVMGFRRLQDDLQEDVQAGLFARAARDIRASIQPGDRYAVVATAPYGMFSRYYGLDVDDPLDEAFDAGQSKRQARQAIRDAQLDRGVIWLLCVDPPAKLPFRSPSDDPAPAYSVIAKARGIDPTPPGDLTRGPRWQMTLYRFDVDRVERRGSYVPNKK